MLGGKYGVKKQNFNFLGVSWLSGEILRYKVLSWQMRYKVLVGQLLLHEYRYISFNFKSVPSVQAHLRKEPDTLYPQYNLPVSWCCSPLKEEFLKALDTLEIRGFVRTEFSIEIWGTFSMDNSGSVNWPRLTRFCHKTGITPKVLTAVITHFAQNRTYEVLV